MSFLLTCPHCGPRDVDEFRYQGEVTKRPARTPTLRELTDYVYFRDNVAGVQREWWYHRIGCGALVRRRARHADERGAADEIPVPTRAARPNEAPPQPGERIDR